jgi:hypothetical protein
MAEHQHEPRARTSLKIDITWLRFGGVSGIESSLFNALMYSEEGSSV